MTTEQTPTGTTDATAGPMQPPELRYDDQHRRLCGAHRSNGEPCSAPAMVGQRVCRMHGGSAPQARHRARLRLMELVDPAVATLARELVGARRSADRLRAAAEILDRAGFVRGGGEVSADEARALLIERIRAIKAQAEAEQAQNDASDAEGGTDS